jgi:hypothetical protein
MSWDLRKGSKKSGLQQRTNPTKNERGRQLGYSTLVPADQPSCGSLTGPLDAFFRVAGGWNGRPQLSPQPRRWGRFLVDGGGRRRAKLFSTKGAAQAWLVYREQRSNICAAVDHKPGRRTAAWIGQADFIGPASGIDHNGMGHL